MAYDFLHYTPGTDILPVDYSWLDNKRIKTFDINSYSFIYKGWEFIFYDIEHSHEIKIMASKGKLRQAFSTSYDQLVSFFRPRFTWEVDSKAYDWSKPAVKWMIKDYKIKTFIYNIKKYFDVVLGRGEMNNVI